MTIEMFKRSAEALEMSYIGEVTAEAYDAGEVNNDTKAIVSISELSTGFTVLASCFITSAPSITWDGDKWSKRIITLFALF